VRSRKRKAEADEGSNLIPYRLVAEAIPHRDKAYGLWGMGGLPDFPLVEAKIYGLQQKLWVIAGMGYDRLDVRFSTS